MVHATSGWARTNGRNCHADSAASTTSVFAVTVAVRGPSGSSRASSPTYSPRCERRDLLAAHADARLAVEDEEERDAAGALADDGVARRHAALGEIGREAREV